MNDNEIEHHLNDPTQLERLYRQSPQAFERQFNHCFEKDPSNQILQVWYARLNYRASAAVKRSIVPMLWLCALASIIMKLPVMFDIDESWFFERFLSLAVALPLAFYFCGSSLKQTPSKVVLAMLALFTLYFALIPDNSNSDSLIMAHIHGPLVLLSVIGLSFVAPKWRDAEQRLNYVRYLGEMLIYSVLILLGGMVLTGMTLGLFNVLGWDIDTWYMDYVVVSGLVSAPIVATYVYDQILNGQTKFATVLSNVFSPLFLVTVSVYLLASFGEGSNPYLDRDFLIFFNGLMLVVWAITVFSISGKNGSKSVSKMDYVNIALIAVTLIINTIALSAIVYRWWEFGMSFNRVVVTGANVLIFVHLCLILKAYLGYLRGTKSSASLSNVIAQYLPVYSAWSAVVVFVLPVLFRFG